MAKQKSGYYIMYYGMYVTDFFDKSIKIAKSNKNAELYEYKIGALNSLIMNLVQNFNDMHSILIEHGEEITNVRVHTDTISMDFCIVLKANSGTNLQDIVPS